MVVITSRRPLAGRRTGTRLPVAAAVLGGGVGRELVSPRSSSGPAAAESDAVVDAGQFEGCAEAAGWPCESPATALLSRGLAGRFSTCRCRLGYGNGHAATLSAWIWHLEGRVRAVVRRQVLTGPCPHAVPAGCLCFRAPTAGCPAGASWPTTSPAARKSLLEELSIWALILRMDALSKRGKKRETTGLHDLSSGCSSPPGGSATRNHPRTRERRGAGWLDWLLEVSVVAEAISWCISEIRGPPRLLEELIALPTAGEVGDGLVCGVGA